MVTGAGLAGGLHERFPRLVLVALRSSRSLVANTINIGADLSGMADADGDVRAASTRTCWVVALRRRILVDGIARFRYREIADILKWLALVLVAYVITAFLAGTALERGGARRVRSPACRPGTIPAWATLVAILGTTISPYLFFWQASQEVEEEKAARAPDARPRKDRASQLRSSTASSMSVSVRSSPTR